jgi:hypothetical protein
MRMLNVIFPMFLIFYYGYSQLLFLFPFTILRTPIKIAPAAHPSVFTNKIFENRWKAFNQTWYFGIWLRLLFAFQFYFKSDQNNGQFTWWSTRDWQRAGWPRGRSSGPGGGIICLLSTSFTPLLGPTQPLIQWVPGAKPPGREPDHSHLTSAEVKNTWLCISHPLYAFMA